MAFQKNSSRRRFLSTAAMAAAGTAFLPSMAWAAEDARVAEIVATTFGIDTHNHVDVPLTEAGMPGPDLDLTGAMRQSGLAAIGMTFATDYQPGDAHARFLHGMDAMDLQLKRNGMRRALTSEEIRAAHGKGQPIVIQAIEGAHFLEGHIERVAEAYQRGLRLFCLLHDSDASVPLGDVYTNPPRFGGLTEFGAKVIKECNRQGILIDLAHADTRTTEAALKLSRHPVIISHTGLDTQLGSNPRMAAMMRPRLIGKEQAKMVAASGGLVGVWTHLTDTPLDYAHNLRAMVDVIGVEHVCLGTDTKMTPPGQRFGGPHPDDAHSGPRIGERTNLVWSNQTDGFYFTVVDAMLKTGFTRDEIAKIGGENFLRVFAASMH